MGAANSLLPGVLDMMKPKKEDPSTMCEFCIKGDSDFVLNCIDLIVCRNR